MQMKDAKAWLHINEEGYAPCPKCGCHDVGYGGMFDAEDKVKVDTHCHQCDFEIKSEVEMCQYVRELETQKRM